MMLNEDQIIEVLRSSLAGHMYVTSDGNTLLVLFPDDTIHRFRGDFHNMTDAEINIWLQNELKKNS